jgi:hypothetical protein
LAAIDVSNVFFQEILTGSHPYREFKFDAEALNHIINRKVPMRPEDVSVIVDDELWAICQECWKWKAADRPSMRIVADNVTDAHDQRKCPKD